MSLQTTKKEHLALVHAFKTDLLNSEGGDEESGEFRRRRGAPPPPLPPRLPRRPDSVQGSRRPRRIRRDRSLLRKASTLCSLSMT